MTYNDAPVTPSVTGEIDVTGSDYTLALDDDGDGDGSTDRSVQPSEEIETQVYRGLTYPWS